MKIRVGHIDDAEQLAEVHVRSWQAAYRGLLPQDYLDGLEPATRVQRWRRSVQNADGPRGETLVATDDDGTIAGFANMGPTRDEDEDGTVAEVSAIYLAPGAWGQGYGRALMGAALARLAQAGYEQVTLWVLDSNARARRFYEAAGFQPDGAVKVDDSLGFRLTEARYRRSLS